MNGAIGHRFWAAGHAVLLAFSRRRCPHLELEDQGGEVAALLDQAGLAGEVADSLVELLEGGVEVHLRRLEECRQGHRDLLGGGGRRRAGS